MKYSKTAIGLLTAQYRSVLKKCLLINLGLFALGAVTATPANALTASAILGSGALTDGVDLVTVDKYSAGNATGGDIGVYGNVAQTNSFTADNITISGTQYGTLLYNGVTFNIGGDNTQTVNISGEAVGLYTQNTSVVNVIASDSVTVSSATGDAITAWAKKENNSWVANSGGKININTGDLTVTAGGMGVSANYGKSQVAINATGDVNITATGGTDNRAIHVGNSTTNDNVSKEDTSFVTIKAENINLTSDKIGVSAMSNGIVELDGNTKIIAKDGDTLKDAILARGKAKVEVNKSGEHTTQMEGNINFNYDAPTSGSIVDAIVDVTLSGADSYWTGNTTASWTGTPPTEDYLNVTSSTINLKDGATWTASQITDTATGEGASASGTKYAVLNNLNVDNANVVVQDATRGVTIDNLVAKNANVSGAGKLNVDKSADLRDGVKNDYAGKINVNDGAELYVDADANGDLDAVDGDKSQIKLANITLISALAAGDKIKTAGYQMTDGALKSLEAYYQTISNDGAGNIVLGAKQAYTDLIGILQNGNYIKAYDAADADNTSVAANLTALDNQVFANATAIDTNTANIATNTDNIATNTAAIADNAAAIANKQDKLKAGNNISIASTPDADGFYEISATDTTYEKATATADGLMSKEDFSKLNGIAAGAQVNTIEGIKVNGAAVDPNSDKIVELTAVTGIKIGDAAAASGEVTLGTMAAANTADYSTKEQADGLYAAKSLEETVAGKTLTLGTGDAAGTATIADGEKTAQVYTKTKADDTFATLSSVSSLTGTVDNLSDTVNGHTTTLTTLQGGATTEGSIDYKIANATIQASKVNGLAAIATSGKYTDLSVDDGAIAQAKVNGLTAALDGKVDAVAGYGLSKNDYTDADKTKLAGIAEGAEVNAIDTIKVNGTAQTITGKAVDITAIEGLAEGSESYLTKVDNNIKANKIAETHLDTDLAGKINGKLTGSKIAYSADVAEGDTYYNAKTINDTFATKTALDDYAKLNGDNYTGSGLEGKVGTQIGGAFTSRTAGEFTPDTSKTVNENIASWSETNADKFANVSTTFRVFNYKLDEVQNDINTALGLKFDKANIIKNTYGGTETAPAVSDTTVYSAAKTQALLDDKADASALALKADLTNIDQTITAKAYKTANWTASEGITGNLLLQSGGKNAAILRADGSFTLNGTNGQVFDVAKDGKITSNSDLVLGYKTDNQATLTGAKIKSYDAAVAELPNKYNWSKITGAEAAGNELAETVSADTHVYSVAAAEQKFLNKTSETADGASMTLDNTNADFAVIGTGGNAYNILRVFSNNEGIILNARPTGTTGQGSTLQVKSDGVFYYKGTLSSDEDEVVTYATAKDGVYTAAQGEDPQSPDYVPAVTIGEAIAGNTSAITTMNGLFEDNPEATTEGQKLTVAASVEKGIRASVVEAQEEGEENGIVADYVISKLTSGDQDIVAASVTANSLTLGDSAPVTGTSGRDAAAIALDDNDMPYVADGSAATLATTASLNQAVNNVLTFAGQTFNAKQQWLDAFTGLDSNKSNAEAFEEEFSGDTNLWVGDGHGEHPTNLAGVFHNINSALGTIHGLVNADGSVNNDTSVFKNGPITSELTGEEISTALRSGTSVEELEVDLDNAVAKIRSGETLVGKAFADKDGNEIDTTYAKLYNNASFNNLYANTLGINGAAQIDGTLRVKGLAQFDDNLSVAKDFSVGGAFTFDENTFSSVATAIDENATNGMLPTAGAVKNIIDSTIKNIEDGNIVAGKAKADQNGKVIDETYATKDEAMLKVDYLYEDTADIDGATIHDGTITGAKLTNNSVTWGKLGTGVQAWIRKIGDADFSDAVHQEVIDATGNVTTAVLALDGIIDGFEDIVGDGNWSAAKNPEIKNAPTLTDVALGIDTLIGDFRTYGGPASWDIDTLKDGDGNLPMTIAQAVHNLGMYVKDGVVTVENTGVQEIKGAKQFNGSATFAKLNFAGGAEVTSISTDEISATPLKTALVTEYAVADAISTAGAGYVKKDDVVTAYDSTISDTNKIYSATVVNSELAKKQDVIEDLDDIREDAALGATSVQGITGEGTGEGGYLTITADDDGHKLISAAKIAEANLTNELKEKIALTGKIGDLSALHPITKNADDSKAENLVVAINNFDDALKKSVETKELNLNGKKVNEINTGTKIVDGVETSDVVTGNGSGSVLATTATVMASAENAKFNAPTGADAVASIGTAETIHDAIVNVGKGVDAVDAKVGSADFTGANNIHNIGDVKPTLTDAINQLDTAIGDVASITANYAKTNTESGSSNPADLATAIQNVATAAKAADGNLNFTEDFTKSVDGEGNPVSPTDLTTAINNVAKNAQDAVAGISGEIHGTGAGSEVTVGDNADKTTIGKTNPDTGLTGIEVDTVNKKITAAVNGNGTSSEIAMDEEGISMTSTVNDKSVGIDIANDDEGRSITMGDEGYGLEIDVDEGTTTIGTGAEGENVQIGKGTIKTDGDVTVGAEGKQVVLSAEDGSITTDGDATIGGSATVAGDLSAAGGNFTVVTTTTTGDEPTSTTTMTLTGDADISGDTSIGGGLDVAGDVIVGEDAVVIDAEEGSVTTAGDVTVGAEGTQVVLGAEDGSITADGDVTVGAEGKQVVLSAEDGSITTDGDATIGGNETVAGTLGVDGATTLGDTLDVDGKTTLSAENGMAFGDGQTVTSIDDGSVAQTMPEDTTTEDPNKSALATVATVLKSAENAKFTGATDENHATGEAETIKQAFQNIDTFVGSKEALTNKGISDKADLTTAFNSFADNVEAGMGGEFAEGGEWSAEISNEADAPEDGYYSAFTAENLAGAISTVYSTIGTADNLQGYNGVSAENTVNDNIAAVNETVGDFGSLKNEFGNLSSYGEEGSQAVAPEDITAALDNIDATFGRIHGLFDGKKVNTTGDIKSTTGSHSNLAKGTTVEMHLVSLDNAIGNRSSITNEKGSNGYVLVARDSVADVLTDIASQIGTAKDLAGATINGVSADNTVNANIAAINSSLGDISELKDAAFAQGATLVDAVKNVDDKLVNLDNRVAKTERDLKELHHDFRRGMASMAAMSALVPNSRSTGKTSLSLGTGAYGGHGAVAVGGFHYITDNLMLNAGVSWSDSSDAAYRMGVTYSF